MCNNGPCTQCQPKYFVSADLCQRCTGSCDTCSSSGTTCTSCISPASLDTATSTCLLCAQPCATCAAGALTSCIKCKQPYSMNANPTNNSCYRCDQDLCTNCKHDDTAVCLECKPGTTLNGGICEQCSIQNCAECSAGTTPVCYQCKRGFSLVNQTRCAPCGPGCLKCSDTNPNLCLECDNGLFINTTTGQCRKCKQGCLECTDPESCSKFADGIVYIGDRRVPCRPGCKVCPIDRPDQCTTCEQRFFKDPTNLVCKSCEVGCSQCTDATTCTKCLNNLNLVSNDCLACQGNCRTCNPANLATCYTCKKGYSLVATQCVHLCQVGCLECDSTDSTICKKCAQGHALTADGKCLKCLGSCSGSCDPKNINICLGCVNGFELLNNKCVRCSFGCLSCLNGQCSECAAEFKLTQTSTGFVCRQRCKFPCLTCSGSSCSACQAGFNLVSGVCRPDFSCNPNCQFCPPGTFKNTVNNQCVACITNCATCTTNADCSQCVDGFYLNAGTCTACPAQCKTCFDATSCKTCSPGFTKEIVSMGTDISDAVYSDKCIACDSNCRTCTVEPDRCTSCPQGFRLFSFRCAGMFTVGYIYQLATAYSTFLTDGQSQRFIQAIAQILGINIKDNYITELRQGSTVIGGTASASSSESATSMSSSLGSSVSGYSVISFTSSVYYGDDKVQQVKENKPNVGLIVGVVIGSVVLIAIIAVIVYKKMKAAGSAAITVKDGRVQSTQLKDQRNNQISYAEEK